MADNHQTDTISKPAVDVRVGGLRLTIQRIPYGLIALVTGALGALGSSFWLGQ